MPRVPKADVDARRTWAHGVLGRANTAANTAADARAHCAANARTVTESNPPATADVQPHAEPHARANRRADAAANAAPHPSVPARHTARWQQLPRVRGGAVLGHEQLAAMPPLPSRPVCGGGLARVHGVPRWPLPQFNGRRMRPVSRG